MSVDSDILLDVRKKMSDAAMKLNDLCNIDKKISQLSSQSKDKVLHWLIEERQQRQHAEFQKWIQEMDNVNEKFNRVLEEKKELWQKLRAQNTVSTYYLM